jgi:hypothetical protein
MKSEQGVWCGGGMTGEGEVPVQLSTTNSTRTGLELNTSQAFAQKDEQLTARSMLQSLRIKLYTEIITKNRFSENSGDSI